VDRNPSKMPGPRHWVFACGSRWSVLRIDSIHLSSEAGGPQIVDRNRQKMLWAASLGVRVWVPMVCSADPINLSPEEGGPQIVDRNPYKMPGPRH